MKGLFIMDEAPFDWVYPSDIREQIQALVDGDLPFLTRDQVMDNLSLLKDVEVVFSGWGGPTLDEEFLEAAPRLDAVFYAAGTVKTIATPASWRRNVRIVNAADANAVPVTEFTLSQILFSLKNGWRYVRSIQQERAYPEKSISAGAGAYGSTVGIISLSKIGRRVCELLEPFDVKVIAYDPYVSEEAARSLGVELCSLEEVFQRADVVSLHTPLLDETRGMITGEHLSLLKPNASFINTARGAIVREDEMIEVLAYRDDITAILDVTYPEPPLPGSPLFTLPNVVLTPHIAGSKGAECARMGQSMLEEFQRYLKNEPLKGEVLEKDMGIMA
ncbi:hydroxyacid dehydrogenase [Fictibacillus fluitans]|uniref:Hydroxyacid dehydrogenase n=1 Tax=Fictibacillus fluitans TaxID=3058422 RepID=A0ABT8HTM2_9BACL|nr:hydroxyacid dehydrogenase [Fictibacillus sp. NE201]MDN4524074.1 hydroxyacid dehydrogenase [Fictibacillus sp. NE201]